MSGSHERAGGGSSVGFLLRFIFCGIWEAIDDLKENFGSGKGAH